MNYTPWKNTAWKSWDLIPGMIGYRTQKLNKTISLYVSFQASSLLLSVCQLWSSRPAVLTRLWEWPDLGLHPGNFLTQYEQELCPATSRKILRDDISHKCSHWHDIGHKPSHSHCGPEEVIKDLTNLGKCPLFLIDRTLQASMELCGWSERWTLPKRRGGGAVLGRRHNACPLKTARPAKEPSVWWWSGQVV